MVNNRQQLIKAIRGRRTSGKEEYAKPFFKWAGGKSQLLYEFDPRFPEDLSSGSINRYIEPFVGGGAVFFYISQLYPLRQSIICDINAELILAWQVVKKDVHSLINILRELQEAYDMRDLAEQQNLFYQVREEMNRERSRFDFSSYGEHTIKRAAQLLFLNKTCFNGLLSVNSEGSFYVPAGRYRNPKILHEELLRSDSELLENTGIHHGDFSLCAPFVDEKTFVYFDPPYRPLNRSSSFTSYSKGGFGDGEQRRQDS